MSRQLHEGQLTGAGRNSRIARALRRGGKPRLNTLDPVAVQRHAACEARDAMIGGGHRAMTDVRRGNHDGAMYHAAVCLCCRSRVEIRGTDDPIYIDPITRTESGNAPLTCISILLRSLPSNDAQVRAATLSAEF